MTHTDLKPENILLESTFPARPAQFHRTELHQKRSEKWDEEKKAKRSKENKQYKRPYNARIKLIDFGNATYEKEHHSSIINTRQYRGPEVILSMGWNERSDIWSMGCILMELYTGELLFGTHDNLEHIHLMEQILKPMPSSMLESITDDSKAMQFFKRDSEGKLKLNELAAKSEAYVKTQVPLKEMVEPHHEDFASFLGELLTIDQTKRPWANEALEISFLSKEYTD